MVKPGGWDPPHSRSMYPVLKETPGWKLFGLLFDRSTLTLCWGWREGWQDVKPCFSTQLVCAGFCRTPGPLLSYLNVCCGCFTWRFTIKIFFLKCKLGYLEYLHFIPCVLKWNHYFVFVGYLFSLATFCALARPRASY